MKRSLRHENSAESSIKDLVFKQLTFSLKSIPYKLAIYLVSDQGDIFST